MKILIDMGLPPAWQRTFEEHGFEARHWSEIGNPKAKDREILIGAKARSKGARTTYTFDRVLAHQEGFSRLR
ncbi:MAG TPA: DUF5615 family PIN-like protein [Thermoanaerobaculia bacterium]|jgi:predicted nuclease of predicted toxin-antitoxin system